MACWLYIILSLALFLTTFGFTLLHAVLFALLCFIASFLLSAVYWGCKYSEKFVQNIECSMEKSRTATGIRSFLENRDRFSEKNYYEQEQNLTGSNTLDAIIEQILSLVIRDCVDSWYGDLSTDLLFKESLKRSARRTIAAFSYSIQKVDFVPLLTQHIVDDVASHMRLFRKAKERAQLHYGKKYTKDDLETMFFDLELEMEKCYCRDLVSTCSHYENAYLHDVTDVLLYLLMPSEDFRSRPFRFLLREIVVKQIISPVLDMLSNPDFINRAIVWLLSESNLRPDDFIAVLESSVDIDELDAILDSLCEEAAHLRAKDSGDEQGAIVKQQLSSIDFAISLTKRKIDSLKAASDVHESQNIVPDQNGSGGNTVQLPIHVVLTNSTAVTFFADFLTSVGGQNLIDCYLAIEGFKISVEHQLRGLSVGETMEQDVYETVKEAANFLYQQYLSQEAITRVALNESVVNGFLSRMRYDEPPDVWFEQVQAKIVDILRTDDRFYTSFKEDPLYTKMLRELGVKDESYTEQSRSSSSLGENTYKQKADIESSIVKPYEGMHVVVETLGIGQQGKQTFALYNVRVMRIDSSGKQTSNWNVIRRYSDFHTLNSLIQSRFPKLNNLCFPGKKTFNNLDSHFLEKRTKALNIYMMSILKPSVLEANPDLESIIFDFLSIKDYCGEKGALSKKVMNAMFEPIKSSVRAFGNAVTAVPDTVYDGVTRVGDGINKAAKQIINFQLQENSAPVNNEDDSNRVAAVYSDQQWMESIPLRVLVLLIGEVFGVRARNAWFRRRLVALLHQFVHATMGTSLNRKIIDIVQWLTSKQQIVHYLTALRNAIWPEGRLADAVENRSSGDQLRTRVLARAMLLSSLPDELRLFIGAETTSIGIGNVSEVLQITHLNRRLLYVIFERLLATIFPDNHFNKIFPQLHAKSPRAKIFQT